MPPRWPRQPDRKTDPEFRRLDDRMNFATHVAIFAAVNSGLWFFRTLGMVSAEGVPGGLPQTPMITAGWSIALAAHLLYVFAIAKYEPLNLRAAGSGKANSGKAKPQQALASSSPAAKGSTNLAAAKSAKPSATKPPASQPAAGASQSTSADAIAKPAPDAGLSARQSKRAKRRTRK